MSGRPRLLLVPAGVLPPMADDELEDWVRLPVPADDLRVRRRRLARLASEPGRRPSPSPAPAGLGLTDPGRELPVP